MAIIGAAMVPHPPLIVPAVGRGGEKQIARTARAYEKAARAVASWRPSGCMARRASWRRCNCRT